MEKKTESEKFADSLHLSETAETQLAPTNFAREKTVTASLIECAVCRRPNALSRFQCLYCGAPLETVGETGGFAPPDLRVLEAWEIGWNVILTAAENRRTDRQTLEKISSYFGFETAESEKLLNSAHALPAARAESAETAHAVKDFLSANNVMAQIVCDADLAMKTEQNRVRAIEFAADYLEFRLTNTNQLVRFSPSDIRLFVRGTLYERQIENLGQRAGKTSGKAQIKDLHEISRDENVLDIYVKNQLVGYRISSSSFDFSCLGQGKTLLAADNFKILLDKLRVACANAGFEDSYNQLRQTINLVWQPDERRESTGWQRAGIGKIRFENRSTVSNANQFLRYSRMLGVLRDF